jgi:hypothetical protein
MATRNHQGFWFNVGAGAGMVHTLILGFSNPCSMGAVGNVGLRALNGLQAVGGGFNLLENVENGNFLMAALDGLGILGNVATMLRACFTGDMQILTRRGQVRWDQLREQDEVASCDEHDPHGVVEFKPVLALFRTLAPIWHVHVRGAVIRTTAEHPFYVWGKGWVAARALEAGDRLRSDDDRMVAVEEVFETGMAERVYNCTVADYHTYFVTGLDWGFSAWAHNSYTALMEEGLTKSQAKRANMLYKTQGADAAREYLRGQGFQGSELRNLMRAAAKPRTGAQRGPNDTSGHNATIRQVASEVTAEGDTVLAGGRSFDGVYRREAEFATTGGFRDSRRPDILAQRPDGSIYGINVGQTEASGLPVLREREAIQDLNQWQGLEMQFVSYGRRQ